MFEQIFTYIINQAQSINILLWLTLFIISIFYDIVYAKYIISISRLNALKSANLSVILYAIVAISTINYISNPLNVIPIIFGSWIGTYVIIKIELKQKNKRIIAAKAAKLKKKMLS